MGHVHVPSSHVVAARAPRKLLYWAAMLAMLIYIAVRKLPAGTGAGAFRSGDSGTEVAADPRPSISAGREFDERWSRIAAIRDRALQTQMQVWRILGLDPEQRETREFGSSMSAQQISYALEAQRVTGNICEIGFFRGLGAANFLAACEDSNCTYHAFESGFNPPVLQYFQSTFGPRFVAHDGDSEKTIPAAQVPGGCSIIHVDGSHVYPTPLIDLRNMRRLAACDHLVMSDDTFSCPGVTGPETAAQQNMCWENCDDSCNCLEKGICNDCSRAYWEAVDEGLVEHHACYFLGVQRGYGKGWCVGRFANPGGCEAEGR